MSIDDTSINLNWIANALLPDCHAIGLTQVIVVKGMQAEKSDKHVYKIISGIS